VCSVKENSKIDMNTEISKKATAAAEALFNFLQKKRIHPLTVVRICRANIYPGMLCRHPHLFSLLAG
jgi:hypothetical protein